MFMLTSKYNIDLSKENILIKAMVLRGKEKHLKFEETELDLEFAKVVDAEIGENPESREKCLRELENKILDTQNLNACLDDEFLLRFLRVSKFNVAKAYERLINYYNSKRKYPQIFNNFYPSASSAQAVRLFHALPYRSQDHSVVVIHRRGLFDPTTTVYEEMTKLDVLILEYLVENPITQKCGISVILDFTSLSLQNIIYETPRRIRMCLDLFQNTFPLRFKIIHIVNAPVIFSLLYNAAYPFLSKKLRSRIIVHSQTSGWKNLHSSLPPELLPEEYGGHLDNSSCIDLVDKVKTREQYFRQQMSYGFLKKS